MAGRFILGRPRAGPVPQALGPRFNRQTYTYAKVEVTGQCTLNHVVSSLELGQELYSELSTYDETSTLQPVAGSLTAAGELTNAVLLLLVLCWSGKLQLWPGPSPYRGAKQ